MINDFDRDYIGDIIADTTGKKYSWFTCHLLRLISRCDYENKMKLKQVYPEEVKAYEKWFIEDFSKKGKTFEDIIVMEKK